MVKVYHKYGSSLTTPRSSGMITGMDGNGCIDWVDCENNHPLILSGCNGDVACWDPQTGQRDKRIESCLNSNSSQHEEEDGFVSCVAVIKRRAKSNGDEEIAIGYSTGLIKYYPSSSSSDNVRLSGHRRSITSLAFSKTDVGVLVSASCDTDAIQWDLVGRLGVGRFRGHTDQITSLVLLDSLAVVVTASKDTLIKVWGLMMMSGEGAGGEGDERRSYSSIPGMCMQSCVAGNLNSENWSICCSPDESIICVGGSSLRISIYEVMMVRKDASEMDFLKLVRYIDRPDGHSSNPVRFLRWSDSNFFIAASSGSRRLELWKFIPVSDDNTKQVKRNNKKKREKKDDDDGFNGASGVVGRFKPCPSSMASGKIKSMSGFSRNSLVLGLADNRLEVVSISPEEKTISSDSLVSFQGHRDSVYSVSVSEDDASVLTVSSDSVRLWNSQSMACICQVSVSPGSEFTGSACFLSGNQYGLVGVLGGMLSIVDFSVADIVYTRPGLEVNDDDGNSSKKTKKDKRRINCIRKYIMDGEEVFATVGSDKYFRVWKLGNASEIEIIEDESITLPISDEGLCLDISQQKLIAIGMLDSNIFISKRMLKEGHEDEGRSGVKGLCLYGHKLPVTCLRFSNDGNLLISGSADKNIKVWNPKFGNCVLSIRAHEGSISSLAIIPHSHLVVSSSKDGSIALWDMDESGKGDALVCRFKNSHSGEVLGLAASLDASFLVSVGSDRAVRKWDRTDEQTFMLEEKEAREREEDMNDLLSGGGDDGNGISSSSGSVVTLNRPSRVTKESIKSTEQLMSFIDSLCKDGVDEETSSSSHVRLAKLLCLIPSNDVAEVVVSLPASYTRKLLSLLRDLLVRLSKFSSSCSLVPIDSIVSVTLTVLHSHARFLLSEPGMIEILMDLRSSCHSVVLKRTRECSIVSAITSHLRRQAAGKPFSDTAMDQVKSELSRCERMKFCLTVAEDPLIAKSLINDADAIIIRSDTKCDSEFFREGRRLKVLVRAGSGLDNVDLVAARNAGVNVMNTPGQNSTAVAELVFGLILFKFRNHLIESGMGRELRGKSLGLLGCGNVSRRVIPIARGFGMSISIYDPFLSEEDKISLEEVVSVEDDVYKLFCCDVVSIHVPLNDSTKCCITRKLLNQLPDNGVLINTARAEVIQEEDLLGALLERPNLSYLADVTPSNFTDLKNSLGTRRFNTQVFVTPSKIGAQTEESNQRCGPAAVQQVIKFFNMQHC